MKTNFNFGKPLKILTAVLTACRPRIMSAGLNLGVIRVLGQLLYYFQKKRVVMFTTLLCRDDTTRTCDPLVPNQVYYQLYYVPNAFVKASAKIVQTERFSKFI